MKTNFILPIIIILSISLGCSFLKKSEDSNSIEKVKTAQNNNSPDTEKPKTVEASKGEITEKNLLSLSNGAYLLKNPPNFGFWSQLLVDGTDDFWVSPGGKGTNQIFTIGLPAETTFKSFSFVKGSDYYGEGSSAKDILVEVSNTDWKNGYQKVLETALPIDVNANKKYPVSAEIPAKFVRLTVKNSHKNPENVSLADFRGYGVQKTENSVSGLSGTYRALAHSDSGETEGEYLPISSDEEKDGGVYNDIFLKQEGTQILGCYRDGKGNRFDGGIEGNVSQTTWIPFTDEEPKKGMMSFSADGKRLYYTEFNSEMGFSNYTVFQKINDKPGNCEGISGFSGENAGKSQIAEDLKKDGRAVIYGINFDYNSDKLRDESKTVLNQIVAILKENADWKMAIEGHTDNIGGESFNQTLSEKRAKSVVDYLTAAGIDAGRLSSSGKGLSSPIEKNDTEFGRAKNRRVELVKQ